MSGSVFIRFLTGSQRTNLLSLESARTRSEPPQPPALGSKLNKLPRYATDVVRECAEAWERLITGKSGRGGISL